ncbi:SpaA isopeptide-forming pilin-related protein [Enterococcus casseliflavus]|uniref:SpaA isopeptide-forming pilin-related protein n=1 Tax=Enterococcus casseliflavus TaxID=37734 RepID=UPI0035DF236D
MNKLKLNTLVAVLFPVVLALLFIWAIPSATTLKADDGKAASANENSNAEVIVVPTTVTDKSLQELTNEDYSAEDSLNKPIYFSEATSKEVGTTATSPIKMGEGKVSVKTGTASFDTNDNPGYDSNETNTIVRSHDQVIYLVSFTIQNDTKDQNYTNIRYRLKATLPNAITKDANGVPQVNGEIANGNYYDNASNDGTQYSEGVMESVISDTGQVFVPVVVNVFDAKHGTTIEPTFELTILDAENLDGGVTEIVNNVYDTEFSVPQTSVSAKPSVQVQLVAGDRKKGTEVFGGTNANLDAYDVGAVTVLQPIEGRAAGDYRGASFPSGPITYTIKQKGTYQVNGSSTTNNLSTGQYANYSIGAYAPAVYQRTEPFTKNTSTVNTNVFTTPLAVPNATTGEIYSSQPKGLLEEIGVYESGNFNVTTNGNVTNSDYAGVVNPYTYLMTGNRTTSASSKSFSSLELIMSWDRSQTETLARTNNWNRYDMTFYIDAVSYDGLTTANNSSISYPNIITPAGAYTGGPVLGKTSDPEDITSTITNLDLNEASVAVNTGNARLNSGDSIVAFNFVGTTNEAVYEIDTILMWDPSALQYDTSREPWASTEAGIPKFKYGVAKNFANSPPTTMQVYAFANTEALYNWYSTPEEAIASGGEISAVACYAKTSVPTGWKGMPKIPLKVIQKQPGNKTPAGNPLVLLTVEQFKDNNGNVLYDPVKDEPFWPNVNYGKYLPTQYDSSGKAISYPMLYVCWIGESAYVNPFSILTKTEVEKELYDTNETISMKVSGTLTGTSTVVYDGALTTTLPKGIHYQANSSKDAKGNNLPEPTVTNNADGTTKLRWSFSDMPLTTGVEVNFKATSDFPELNFDSSGFTGNLTVSTVGEMWRKDDSTVKDEAVAAIRSSSDTFKENLIQQVIVSKTGDKKIIEVGDDTPVGVTDAIKYTMTTKNESAQPIKDVRISDVLPYDGDSRGTIFHGSYKVTEVTVDDPNAKIYFTNETVSETTDPNDINDWTLYSSNSDISKAKGFLVTTESLPVGDTITLTVTIDPTGQEPGDVLVNNIRFNSYLDMDVRSQNFETTVYGRDLTGVAWYDDNLDGLIGNLANGTKELAAQDIPVKLYRTSFVEETYQNELVKESLSGEKFVDDSGNSLIKTDATGKYIFQNLPEGEYIAEFVVGDQVVQKKFAVTTPLVGDDPTLNSKADQDTFKTAAYDLPELTDLAADENLKEQVHHVTDVNIGLIRLSTIRLFKYETGTAVDANGDGKLSDVEKASGTALADATFDLYKGNDQTEKIGSATTDASGYLNFTGIQPGEYNLVETKAPAGYELIKKPIKVTIGEGNQTIMVYQENDKTTELPQAGVNGPVVWLVGIACAFGLAGIWALYYYYDQLRKKGA